MINGIPRHPLQKNLLAWYQANKRDLPWRRTRDPYAIWISEIMLQQTQVDTVIPYFNRWLKKFPGVRALARAREEEVLKAWEGLGYYSRARNLHRAAKEMAAKYKGKLPETREELLALPGIGPYTAGAILSIAFRQNAPLVDGNVIRVMTRLFNIHADTGSQSTQKRIWGIAASLVPKQNPGDFNQALMELGATVCVPGEPLCLICPLNDLCLGFKKSSPARLPFRKAKVETQKFEGWIFLIEKKGRWVIQQRPRGTLMGGLWEFPSVMDGYKEAPEEIAKKKFGIAAKRKEILGKIPAAFTKYRGVYRIAHLECRGVRPHAPTKSATRWAHPKDFSKYTFTAPSRKALAKLGNRGT